MPASIQDRLKKLPPYDDVPEEEVEEVVEEPEEESKEEPEEEVTEEEALENSKNPKRTGKFIEKLKEENKELKKNVLDSLRLEPVVSTDSPPFAQPIQEFTPEIAKTVDKHTTELNPDNVDDIYANLIDENGYIDANLLITTLKTANEEARKAREAAESANKRADESERTSKKSIRDFEEDREVRRVHKKYPQIDPKKEEFNEMFWDDVRKEIATAPILRGENVSFMDAADKIWKARYTDKEVEPVKKKDKEVMTKKVDQKKNINASVPSGHFEGYYSDTDTKELNEATRLRKKGALAERLRRSGH